MGKLYIEADERGGRTVVTDIYFTAPFKCAKPFYDRGSAEVMIMQASAGILSGDRNELKIRAVGGRLRVTGQSYTKLFNTGGGSAAQRADIEVSKGAALEYLMPPVIPFALSNFTSETKITVSPGARLAVWDIFACGRVGMGEKFAFDRYHSQISVYEDGIPVFMDNALYSPGEMNLDGIGRFEGYTHAGMLYLYGYDDINGDIAGSDKERAAAVTRAKRGQVLRVLAHSSETITRYMAKFL